MSKVSIGEQELADRCRRGDNLARKSLYELYAGRMLGVCLRYVGNRAVAEDLLHDAFLLIFKSFDKFIWKGEGSLRAWMERIAVNEALRYLRKESRFRELTVSPEESCEPPSEEEVERLPREVLMHFIGKLPAGYRTVLNLYVFEERPHREIAALLGISEKSSASQLARAKALLATYVNEWMKKNEI